MTLIGGGNEWHSSRDRVAAVIIGCVCALAVGFLFDKLASMSKFSKKKGGGEPKTTE